MKKHHKKEGRKKTKKIFINLGWFLIWTLIYSIFYLVFGFLLKEMLGSYRFFQIKIFYILIMGLCFSIFSRTVYSLIYKQKIYLGKDVFFLWTITYALSIWFFEFLKNLFINKLGFSFISNKFVGFIFIGIGVCLSVKLVKRMEFGVGVRKHRFIRAPSQIASGIILIVLGILCWRFSELIFIKWIGWAEGMAWSWLIGLGFIIGGFLTLVAWWRNNVLQHRIGVKFGHWN